MYLLHQANDLNVTLGGWGARSRIVWERGSPTVVTLISFERTCLYRAYTAKFFTTSSSYYKQVQAGTSSYKQLQQKNIPTAFWRRRAPDTKRAWPE